MNEQEARDAITEWAKDYCTESEENVVPEVEIVKIAYNEGKKEWSAELEVSTSANHTFVTFFLSDESGSGGLQIATIEY